MLQFSILFTFFALIGRLFELGFAHSIILCLLFGTLTGISYPLSLIILSE